MCTWRSWTHVAAALLSGTLAAFGLIWVPTAYALSLGPVNAGAAVGWTDPDSAGAADGACASTSTANSVLTLSGFGLAVPTDAEIRGVLVQAKTAAPSHLLKVALKKPDGKISANKSLTPSATTCAAATAGSLGGATDRWGLPTLLPADLNSASFAVLISSGSGTGTRYVDVVTVTVHYAPKPPSGLIATAASPTQINLTWTDGSTLDNDVHIERCVGNRCTSFAELTTVDGGVTSYTDTGLTDNTLHRYRVRGHEHTAGLFSGYAASASTNTPPAAPTGLSATTAAPTRISLSWTDNSTLEREFSIERCAGSACSNFRQVGTATRNSTSYSDGAVALDTTFRYRVRARGLASNLFSDYTGIVSAQTGPKAPTRLKTTSGGATQINLAWGDASAIESDYHIERCGGLSCTNFAEITTVAAGSTSYADSGLALDTLYSYRVRAHEDTNGLFSSYSNIASFTTAPAAPAGLAATAVSAAQVNLTWTENSTIENRVYVESCTGSGCSTFRQIASLAADTAAYSSVNLAENTTYRYRVRVQRSSSALYSSYSAVVDVITPPKPPSSLTATGSGATSVSLRWADASRAESDYHIERCTGAGCGGFAEIDSVTAGSTTYADTTVSENTTYQYRVRAHQHDSALHSSYSASAAATTPLSAPTDLAATTPANTQIDLSWTDTSSAETDVHLERCVGSSCSNFTEITTVTSGTTAFSNTGLVTDTLYRYRVRAHEHAGGNHSAYSTIVSATTAPDTPSGLAAIASNGSTISLSWTDESAVESDYHIEFCAGAACADFAEIATVSANIRTYSSTGLSENTLYRYRIRAHLHSSSLYSGYSAIASATTLPTEPSGLAATAVSGAQIDLSWTDNSSAESDYHIERCLGAVCTSFVEIATPAADTTTYSDPGLSENITYRYRVRAHEHAGSNYSTYSSIGSATTTPNAPSGLAATAASDTQINLTWTDNSATESDFHIERCSSVGCSNFVELTTVIASVSSYSNTGLTEGTVYVYRVRAHQHGSALYSPYSDTASASTQPAAPSGLTTTISGATQVDLAWADNAAAESEFHIERCTGVGCTTFVETATAAVNATAYSNTGLSEGTVYRYRVRADDHGSGLNSSYSAVASATTAPSAPSGLGATPVSAGQIDLAWTDNSAIEADVHVERCLGAACTNFIEVTAVGSGTSSFPSTGLTADTLYRFQVRAHEHTDSIYSSYSAIASATTAPSAPSGLEASAASASLINLLWADNSTTESAYSVERCTGAGCINFAEITLRAANTTSHGNAALTADTTYRYRVRAFSTTSGLYSSYSAVASATTGPTAPSGLTATAVGATQVNLSWTDSSASESDFHIERCTGAGCTSFAEIATVTAATTSYSNTGLSADTVYLYRVRAHDHTSGLYSSYSGTASATTTPNAPSGLAATPISATQIDLTWTDNSAIESDFHIERCTGSGCSSFAEIATVTANATSYSNTGLSGDTIYGYRVRAQEHGGGLYSAYSNTASATTAPNAPSGLTATGISATQINLSWTDNSAVETEFHIERCTGSGCSSFAEIATVTANTTAYSNTGLSGDTIYSYRVRAHDHGSGLYSNYSGTVSAATTPNAPSGLTATTASSSQINLAWTDNSAVESDFHIERCAGLGCTDFAEITTVAADTTTYSDTGRSESTLYRYRIRAHEHGGGLYSSYSAIASDTTLPSAPSALNATPVNPTRIDLSWTDNSGVESEFHIERCLGPGCTDFTEIATNVANNTTYSDTGLAILTTYRYRVRAHDHATALFSSYSNVASTST